MARPLLVLNRVTVIESSFQAMADASMKEVRKLGNALAKEVRAASPVGPRRKKRSKASRLYGPLRSGKTKFVARGKRRKEWKDGKRKWRFFVERTVLVVPFYGYFQDKGWQPRGRGAFVPGSGYVTRTISRFRR